MRNLHSGSVLAALAKAASQAQAQSPGQQALMAAANLAKPPGAPPLPKPVDPADPAGDVLAQQDAEIQQQKLELEKQRQEAMHRKEVADKDKEIAGLRQDLQGANMEAQRLRNQMEMLKQRQADADKLRAESEKLNSRRDQMAGEEAQHKARMSEAVAEAKATIAEERAKSTEQAANSNAQAYVKMTEDARKRSDEMFAGARDDVMKQREDVLKQKESILADKSKAFDERMNAANERNRMSPYLMKSLQDAASAARNIAKLRDRSLNSMDNVFLSDMPKAASQQYQQGAQQPASAPSNPSSAQQQQTSRVAAAGGANNGTQGSTGVRVYDPGNGNGFERDAYERGLTARRMDAVRQLYGNGDTSASGYLQNAANLRNTAYQYKTIGTEFARDESGDILKPDARTAQREPGYGRLYASSMDQLADEYEAKGHERANALSSKLDRTTDETIELARYKDWTRKAPTMFHGSDRSLFDRMSNEARDVVSGNSGFSLSSFLDPTTFLEDGYKNYRVSKDMERAYGNSPEGRAAFREAARAAGVSTSELGRLFNLGLGYVGTNMDAALTALTFVPFTSWVGTAGKGVMAGAKAALGVGKAAKLGKMYQAYRAASQAARAAGSAGKGGTMAALNRVHGMTGGWKGTAAGATGVGGVSLMQNQYNPQGLLQAGAQQFPMVKMSAAPQPQQQQQPQQQTQQPQQPSGSTLPPVQPGDNPVPPAAADQRGTTDTAGWINGGYNFNNLNNAASSTFVNYGPVAAARMVGSVLGSFIPVDMNLIASGSPYQQEMAYRRGMMNNAMTAAAFDVDRSAHYRNWRSNDATSSAMQDDLKQARDDAAERYYGYKRNDSIWSI